MVVAYIVGFFAAFVLSVILTPIVIRLARTLRLYDPRGPRKTHTAPTPRVGGIAIFGSMMIVAVVTMIFDAHWDNVFGELKPKLMVIFGVGTFIFLVGVWDVECR